MLSLDKTFHLMRVVGVEVGRGFLRREAVENNSFTLILSFKVIDNELYK